MTNETMIASSQRFNNALAFEVSKARLHVHIAPGDEIIEIVNARAAPRSVIVKEVRRNKKLGVGPLLVVCEATGTYRNDIAARASGLIARRTELRQAREAEEARVEHVTSRIAADSLRAHIRFLGRSIAQIASRIDELTSEDEEFRWKSELMQSVEGVGALAAAAVLA
jgi:hypothetical protein